MFARYTTVRGDPDKIAAAVDRVDGEVRSEVEAAPGNRGFAVLTGMAPGLLLGASYWDSAESLRTAEDALAQSREAVAAEVGGEMSVERLELAIGFRHTIPTRGAVARLSRFEVAPTRVAEAITLMQEEAVPQVKGTAGLCSFQMLVDRESGAGLIISAWDDSAAVEAFWPTAERLRARASDRVGIRFRPPENYTLIRTTVRLD